MICINRVALTIVTALSASVLVSCGIGASIDSPSPGGIADDASSIQGEHTRDSPNEELVEGIEGIPLASTPICELATDSQVIDITGAAQVSAEERGLATDGQAKCYWTADGDTVFEISRSVPPVDAQQVVDGARNSFATVSEVSIPGADDAIMSEHRSYVVNVVARAEDVALRFELFSVRGEDSSGLTDEDRAVAANSVIDLAEQVISQNS